MFNFNDFNNEQEFYLFAASLTFWFYILLMLSKPTI